MTFRKPKLLYFVNAYALMHVTIKLTTESRGSTPLVVKVPRIVSLRTFLQWFPKRIENRNEGQKFPSILALLSTKAEGRNESTNKWDTDYEIQKCKWTLCRLFWMKFEDFELLPMKKYYSLLTLSIIVPTILSYHSSEICYSVSIIVFSRVVIYKKRKKVGMGTSQTPTTFAEINLPEFVWSTKSHLDDFSLFPVFWRNDNYKSQSNESLLFEVFLQQMILKLSDLM